MFCIKNTILLSLLQKKNYYYVLHNTDIFAYICASN